MDVSDVLRDRIGEPAGLERMTIVSLLVHAAVIGGLFLMPAGWLSRSTPPPKTVMTISLSGGNGGPNNGGFSNISQRAIQTEAPPPPRPEPVRPPAAETPAMTVPLPQRTPPRPETPRAQARRPTPAPKVEQAPDDARGRTPTRGEETREGNAVAETGARGQGFGLSTSSGSGAGAKLDIVGDFCCPEYISLMVDRIRSGWDSRAPATAIVIVKYTIQRDGTIGDTSVERSSGDPVLDLRAQRAVISTRLPALPAAFNYPTLPVHLTFEYKR